MCAREIWREEERKSVDKGRRRNGEKKGLEQR